MRITVDDHDWSAYQTKPGYHEWRHKHHIDPFIDRDGKDRLFYDLGANAGYHMREAQKLGYRVLGVEGDPRSIEISPDLNIVQGNINYMDLVPAYITLLSCIHYHQSPEQVDSLFHALSYNTAYIILMARKHGKPRSNPSKKYLIKNHLRYYDVLDEIDSRRFYSLFIKNKGCEEFNVNELYEATLEHSARRPKTERYINWVPYFEEFVLNALDDMDYDSTNSPWFEYLKNSRLRYPLSRCWRYKRMIEEIREGGPQAALKVRDGYVYDGMHRLIILKELGYTRVICRV